MPSPANFDLVWSVVFVHSFASPLRFCLPPMPIPAFDHNLVLPPHLGDPRDPGQLSPYPCTTLELSQRFGATPERKAILGRFLDFRERLRNEGLLNGYQWLDGSFCEDIETQESRPPGDLDVITTFWGYDLGFLSKVAKSFPEFWDRSLAKAAYSLDHFPFDAGYSPELTVEQTRYWILLFSHNRIGVWKGMLKLDISTPADDTAARQELTK